MSQIFDALHRSEAGRQGIDRLKIAAATDLLEAAERQLAQGRPEDERQTAEMDCGESSPFQPAKVLVSSQSKLVCSEDGDSLAAEKFRFLGVRLRHLQQKRPFKRLLITSSMPQEGKSTIAANLACSLATRLQRKILLLEGDLRRPTLTQRLGLGALPGLSEWLAGESSPATNICQLDGLGFCILPAGNPASDPLALMRSEKLPMLMDQLNSWFDWIVIDSPPVLPLADTSVWMRLADAILLVTRPGISEKRQLQRTLDMIERPKLLGALVNGSAEAASSAYYYYGRRQGVRSTPGPRTQ